MFGQDGLRRIMSQETLKPKKVRETISRFGHYFRPYWPILLVILALVGVSTWAQVLTPDLIGQAVDCYLSPRATTAFANLPGVENVAASSNNNCWYAGNTTALSDAELVAGLTGLILRVIGLYVMSAVITGFLFFLMNVTGTNALKAIRIDLFRQLHRLSLAYYAEHEAGDLMSRITNDSETIQQAFNFALINVLAGSLLIAWIAYNMLAKSLPYALISLSVVPVMGIATYWFSDQARRAFRRTRREMGSVNANLQESIASVREVQAFNRVEENIANFRVTNAANRDANVRAVAFTSALAPTLEAVGYLALALVTVTGGLYLLRGEAFFGTVVSLGLIVTFLGYVQRFNQPIQQISILWTNVQNAIAGGERIFGLLDVTPQIQDRPGAKVMPEIRGRVEFDKVCAGYSEGQPVLKDVSFTAEPGQSIAIVGPTGAGKTTLVNLIPRFFDVTDGRILIDGTDVREVTLDSLRSQIGIVLQDTFLFSTTLMENIRFGRPEASDAEVIAAAELAHADTFIDRLPDKYQTVLGERGGGISQGQRQLIAIARAALAKPSILILDEATSSVDTRTERLIQKALEQLLQGRTSFVIAHRLSTIRNADEVLVVNEGRIIERGKHDQLLEKRGFYFDLYMSQFRREAHAVPAIRGNGHDGQGAAIGEVVEAGS